MKNILLPFLLICASISYGQNLKISASQNPKCPGHRSILEATNGFFGYQWNTNDSSRSIVVIKPGIYIVKAYDTNRKWHTDTIEIKDFKVQKVQVSATPNPVCKGDSVKLLASAGFKTYFWSDGNTNKSVGTSREVWVAVSQNTTFNLTVYDSNNCTNQASVRVEIKNCNSNTSCPKIISAWPKKHLCGNHDSLTLEAKWGYSTYYWITPDQANNGSTGRVIYLNKPGKYIVIVTDQAKDTCRDTIEITQSKLQDLKISVSPVKRGYCPGDVVELSASKGFHIYEWSTRDSTREIRHIFNQATQFWVYGTDSNGCRVKAFMSLMASDSCKKDSNPPSGCKDLIPEKRIAKCGVDYIEVDAIQGYKKYFWSNGKESRATKITSSGRYYVFAFDNDCNVCVDSVDVILHRKMEFNVQHNAGKKLCKGDTLVMEATKGMKTYWWSTGQRNTRIVKMVPDSSMKVVVEAVDSNGCAYRKVLEITVDTCKTNSAYKNQFLNDDILVFPNPADALLNIDNRGGKLSGSEITITDMQGRVLQRVTAGSEAVLHLDLSYVSSGHYNLIISKQHERWVKRIVVE